MAELDQEWFKEALIERLPGPLHAVFRLYSTFDVSKGLALVVSPEVAVYFADQHPREPDSDELGLRESDPVRIFSDATEPHVLKSEVLGFRPKEFVADLRATDEVDVFLRSEQVVAICSALEPDEEDPAFIQALLSPTFLTAPEAQRGRDALLRLGALNELFDFDEYWYAEWSRGEPAFGTQITSVPAAVRYESFWADLSTWKIGDWGRFVRLPPGRPWKWSSLPSAAPDLIDRGIKELTQLDPQLPAHAAAYMRLATLELALFYLVDLCLGEDRARWWSLLDEPTKKRLSGELARTEDPDELPLGLTFTDFQRIVRSAKTWPHFARAVHPKGKGGPKNAFKGFEAVEAIRNRTMHPVRLLAHPIRPRDLALLDQWLVQVRTMIARAEDLRGEATPGWRDP